VKKGANKHGALQNIESSVLIFLQSKTGYQYDWY